MQSRRGRRITAAVVLPFFVWLTVISPAAEASFSAAGSANLYNMMERAFAAAALRAGLPATAGAAVAGLTSGLGYALAAYMIGDALYDSYCQGLTVADCARSFFGGAPDEPFDAGGTLTLNGELDGAGALKFLLKGSALGTTAVSSLTLMPGSYTQILLDHPAGGANSCGYYRTASNVLRSFCTFTQACATTCVAAAPFSSPALSGDLKTMYNPEPVGDVSKMPYWVKRFTAVVNANQLDFVYEGVYASAPAIPVAQAAAATPAAQRGLLPAAAGDLCASDTVTAQTFNAQADAMCMMGGFCGLPHVTAADVAKARASMPPGQRCMTLQQFFSPPVKGAVPTAADVAAVAGSTAVDCTSTPTDPACTTTESPNPCTQTWWQTLFGVTCDDTPPAEPTMFNKTLALTTRNRWAGTSECPQGPMVSPSWSRYAPTYYAAGLEGFRLDLSFVCSGASGISPVVIAGASLAAMWIVLGAFTRKD